MKWPDTIEYAYDQSDPSKRRETIGLKINKYFGIHPSRNDVHKYTLTHLPTGWSIRQTFTSSKKAEKVAEKLVDTFGDKWDFTEHWKAHEIFEIEDKKKIRKLAGIK